MNKYILAVVFKSNYFKEARKDYSVSSNEQNFLSELENPNSLNEALDDMFRQIEDSPDIPLRVRWQFIR